MISIDDYLSLPEDKHLAWAMLEQKMRKQVMDDLHVDPRNYSDLLGDAESYQVVLNSFAEENSLQLEIRSEIEPFSDSQSDNYNEVFRSIMKSGAANQIRAMSRVASVTGYASKFENPGRVQFNADLRTELLSKIETIRKIIYNAELEKSVESRILTSLSRFQRSVEEMRTSIAQYGQIAVDLAEAASSVAEKLEPAIKILQRIGSIFKRSQLEQIECEEAPRQLPKPLDDEIPF